MENNIILVTPYKETGYLYIKASEKLGLHPILYFNDKKENILDKSYFDKNLRNYLEIGKYQFIFDNDVYNAYYQIKEKHLNLAGVIPCTEPGVIPANQLASLLGLIGNDPNTIESVRNKYKMRQVLLKNPLKNPQICILRKTRRISPEGYKRNWFSVCNQNSRGWRF